MDKKTNNMTSAFDGDIPVAIATPEFVTDHHHQMAVPAPTMLTKGRSSRVIIPDSSGPFDQIPLGADEIRSLKSQGFTMGLINAMQRNNQVFPMRIWVVDNSGALTLQGLLRFRQILHSTQLVRS